MGLRNVEEFLAGHVRPVEGNAIRFHFFLIPS
jgi:hypothetical protein